MSLAENMSAPLSAVRPARDTSYLYGPVLDFLLLGGGSIFVMLAVWLMIPANMSSKLSVTMMILANFINHPHFAHSYQIFYRDFRSKAFGGHYSAGLRYRYVFAGIVAPIFLTGFFLSAYASGSFKAIGYGINIMGFFVGWHYVKQGYGMLMLDSAIKKRFFTPAEKKIALFNAYTTWVFAWVSGNIAVHESNMWGLKSVSFGFPAWLSYTAAALAVASLVVAIATTMRKARAGEAIAWNGIIAYLVSIYPWLMANKLGPVIFLVVPAAHSLQYLAVVWRYQLSREQAEAVMDGKSDETSIAGKTFATSKLKFAAFITKGTILGFLGFWGIPIVLDALVPYDQTIFGSTMFLAIFWLFINVHHYFIDNVMWRRENTDMKKYLFG